MPACTPTVSLKYCSKSAQPYCFEEYPPPSYYVQEDVDVFQLPRHVQFFLEAHRISRHQCAKIVEVLRYHCDDWRYGFKAAGLEATVAYDLWDVLLQSLPSTMLDMHYVAENLPNKCSPKHERTEQSSSETGGLTLSANSNIGSMDEMLDDFDSFNVASGSDSKLEYV